MIFRARVKQVAEFEMTFDAPDETAARQNMEDFNSEDPLLQGKLLDTTFDPARSRYELISLSAVGKSS
jgi:hypothetical protein